jgi:cytochrome o ubiquinol oxidase subunit 1
MAGFGVIGAAVTLVAFMFRRKDEVEIPADEVGLFDRAHPVEVSL